jgi:hypothetical protein
MDESAAIETDGRESTRPSSLKTIVTPPAIMYDGFRSTRNSRAPMLKT